jgi:hypothetical protein
VLLAEFVSRRAGIAAGVLLALYPPAIFMDALIQKSGLSLLLMTLLLWALASAQKTAGRWLLGACGALLGLLMLTREETLCSRRCSRSDAGACPVRSRARGLGHSRRPRWCWRRWSGATPASGANSC